MRINEDGNTLGRITAFAALVAVVVGVGKISGLMLCPTTSAGCCPTQSATATK